MSDDTHDLRQCGGAGHVPAAARSCLTPSPAGPWHTRTRASRTCSPVTGYSRCSSPHTVRRGFDCLSFEPTPLPFLFFFFFNNPPPPEFYPLPPPDPLPI